MKNAIFFSSLFFLALFGAACMHNPSDLPEPEGYDGFLELGWQAIQQDQYLEAFEYFQQAIDVDVMRAEGFLGAGVASLFLEDYWDQGNDFLQIAIQRDLGISIVVQHLEEVQTQDTLWTLFECVDPDLPEDSLDLWLSLTADSGAVWVGLQIYNYLTVNELNTNLLFRFRPVHENAVSCLDLYHPGSGWFLYSDSMSDGYVYVTVPVHTLYGSGEYYYTWVMVNQGLSYDYATFDAGTSAGQITLDALAIWSALQELRGEDGDILQAAACAQGLLQIAPDYSFGYGIPMRESVFDIDIVDVTASGASSAFFYTRYIYAWSMCKHAGYGLDLDPLADDFLFDLLELLMQMKG
ncbi:MAG: hypothetical protein KAH54_01355 [Candidatus Sabulitectum sp.]|nr:hypothetical protein [Candidatus Sabulitectum sp.]